MWLLKPICSLNRQQVEYWILWILWMRPGCRHSILLWPQPCGSALRSGKAGLVETQKLHICGGKRERWAQTGEGHPSTKIASNLPGGLGIERISKWGTCSIRSRSLQWCLARNTCCLGQISVFLRLFHYSNMTSMTLDWLSSLFSLFCMSILTGEKDMKRWTVSNYWQQCNNASAWQVSCSISPNLVQSGTYLRVSLGTRCLQRALCSKAMKGRVLLGLQTCCVGCGFWVRTFENRWGTHFSLSTNPFLPCECQ